MIKDAKTKRMVIERTKKDFAEFQRLRLRSELRNPPIDKAGNENTKRKEGVGMRVRIQDL